MNRFLFGVLAGSVLTSSLGLADQFYNSNGQPAAPRGSVQQYDYFRQRQQYLDINAMRKQADRERLERQVNPCVK